MKRMLAIALFFAFAACGYVGIEPDPQYVERPSTPVDRRAEHQKNEFDWWINPRGTGND